MGSRRCDSGCGTSAGRPAREWQPRRNEPLPALRSGAESAARFGDAASERYERLIATALIELASDPGRPGSRAAPDLVEGARIYHLRSSKRRARTSAGAVGTPRHFVLYRVLAPDTIGIARILHDSMDLPAHATDHFGAG